jgi:hypothetical protein
VGREARINAEKRWPMDRFGVKKPQGDEVIEAAGFALGQTGELAFYNDQKKTTRVFAGGQWTEVELLPDLKLES